MSKKKEVAAETKMRYKFKFKDDYNPVYINGVYGGFNHFGEMVIHFYQERYPIPNEQINKESGEVSHIPEDFGDTRLRMVQTGVVMNESMAVVLRDWLTNWIDTTQKIEEER